jgi:hypothetical protein
VQSVFVYVREAHPGEHYGHHESFAQKMELAREFKRLFNVRRPILVDDIDGTAHSAFGRLPNMTYILGPGNRVVFRSDWTDPDITRTAIAYLLARRSARREGMRLAPFYAEIEGSRWVDNAAFTAGLVRNGPRAVDEFAEAQARWARGEHLGSLRHHHRTSKADV